MTSSIWLQVRPGVFIAPPVVADINRDQVLDIIANAVEGKMMAFNGRDNQILWIAELPGTEVYSSIAVGRFTEDSIPDFFTNFGRGIFSRCYSILSIDGETEPRVK